MLTVIVINPKRERGAGGKAGKEVGLSNDIDYSNAMSLLMMTTMLLDDHVHFNDEDAADHADDGDAEGDGNRDNDAVVVAAVVVGVAEVHTVPREC